MILPTDCAALHSACDWRLTCGTSRHPIPWFAADAALSSIATTNSARIAYGWRVFEEMLGGIYVGPVIEYFGSDGYRHLRLGAHITSIRTEDTEWSAAAGWAQDSQGRASPYLRLNMLKCL